MKYEFKQAVKIMGVTFARGVHEVAEEIEKHLHFAFFKKAGYIKVAGATMSEKKLSDLKTLPPPSTEAAKRSQASAAAVQAPAVTPDAVVGGEAPATDAASEDDAQSGSKKSGKKGR